VVGAQIAADVRDPAIYRAEIERFWLVRVATAEMTVNRGQLRALVAPRR
jgi:hypothetical protein